MKNRQQTSTNVVSFKNKNHIITQKYKESGFKIEEQTEILGDDSESEAGEKSQSK